MNDDLSVLLKVILDSSGIGGSDISEIQKILEKYTVNVAAELDKTQLMNSVKQVLPQVIKEISKLSGTDIKIDIDDSLIEKSINQVIQDGKRLEKELTATAQRVNKIQLSIGDKGDTTTQIKTITDNFTKLGLSADEVKTKMSGVDTELSELKTLLNSGASNSAITAQFDKLQASLKETQNDLKTTRSEYSLLVSAQQRLSKANTIEAWKQKNSAATKQAQIDTQAYIDTLRNLNVQMTKMEFEQISRGFKETENSMRGLGKLGASLKDQTSQAAQSFTQWLSVSSGIMALVYQLQKIPKEVIEVDSAMIELNKVSDASASDIKNYFNEAAESAKKYGSSVSDMINATADWSRLGYNLPDSKKLAEVAMLYKNVGDGIDINTANESLVSTLQGFQLEAEDALSIIDRFNEVANNFPIDTAGIGEALQRSAASFYAANTDLSKSIALITGTNSVVQDPSRVGNMWKTVSMRIRGAVQELEEAGEDTDGVVESTAQLRDLVKGLTGFDIMADEAGTQFKDIYDIVVGIGHEWQNLTDIEQAGLLETLAGKMQGNALSAALNNISMIEEAYETAENSAGSALEEQEAYEQGIQYSLERLEASFQTFANHTLNSDFLKGIVDFGNGVINVIDSVTSKLDSLGTIGLGVGLFSSIKNVGNPKMFGFSFV